MASLFKDLGGTTQDFEEAKTRLQKLEEIQVPTIETAIPEETVTEATFNANEVHDLAKNDMDFFAALAIPAVFKYCFPKVFKSVWGWLLEYVHKSRDFSQLALGLPRGFGKTIVVKLFVLYCILFTSRKFILILAENQTKANNMLSDVVDMLNEENIKKVFGHWNIGIETDRQDLKKFGFRGRNIILMAGTVEVIRGISLKNERPDVMIFDDIQSRVMAESQTVSETLEREMVGTAMKAKSPHGCLFIFVGNMYPTKWSILRKLKSNPNWIKFIAGGINKNGESLWEELQPIEQLLREFENDLAAGRPEIFYSEVLNDENASPNYLVDFQKLPAYPFQEDDTAAGSFIVIDPATDKIGSDAVSIGYFEVHDAKPVLMELEEGRFSPGETIKIALKFCLTHNCRTVGIESNAYQYTLKYWFDFICMQMGIAGIEAVELYSGHYSKNSRILSMFKSYMAGEFHVHERCKPAVHLQITGFNPLKRDNTDGLLDLLTYAPRMIELYGDFITSMNVIESQEYNAIPIIEHNSAI